MPVTHRPDFKQALSTLQRLKQKAEGDSQVPTYSNRNQHAVFGKILLDKTFLNSITLLQMDRLQLTAVYCNRRGGVSTTPQMPCFRGAKVCSKWLQERRDDQSIQSDNKYKSGLKVRIQ